MSVKQISCEGLAILVEAKLALLEEMQKKGITLYRVMKELGYSRSKIYGMFREPNIDMSIALFFEIIELIGASPSKIISKIFNSPLVKKIKESTNEEECKQAVLDYWYQRLSTLKNLKKN